MDKAKLKKLWSWVGLLTLFILLMNFKWIKQAEQNCLSVNIKLYEKNGVQFLTKKDVARKIESKHPNIVGMSLSNIKLDEIETSLLEIPQVKSVKAYLDIGGDLNVSIKQRVPVIRLHRDNGDGYYIDQEGVFFPLSSNFSYRVLVVNGNVARFPTVKNIAELKADKVLAKRSNLDELYSLGLFIQENSFWKAQIQQAHVNEKQEVTLIPRVGSHIIELGKCTQLETKFNKLKTFYEEGLRYTSWRAYSKINLEYKNQVVCTKK
jgi:cell division protein FtsQ